MSSSTLQHNIDENLKANNVSKQILDERKINSNIYDIKWSMIDKKKYFPLTIVNMFVVRSVLYPLTLVRTRLQVQASKAIYSGTIDAFRKIIKYEGTLALFKGYWVNSFQLVPHVMYITSYEKVRHQISMFTNNTYIIAFVGGGAGSVFAQTLSVPIDVISQHMMLVGQRNSNKPSPIVNQKELDRIHVPDKLKSASTISIAKYLTKEIYKNEQLKGFYRGFFLCTFLVSINSALWWPFYYFYQGQLRPIIPIEFPTLAVQCLCGPLSSFSSSLITNPMDVLRTRMQILKHKESGVNVLKELWKQDGYKLFYKGLTARLSYSCFYSFFIILGYETVKKYSLKEEYQYAPYPID